MTRRLIMALVGTAVAALLVAGVGTLLLARAGAREETRAELEAQVDDLATFGGEIRAPVSTFNRLQRLLELDGLMFLVVQPDGAFRGELPEGVDRSDLDLSRLRAGEVLSGERRGRAWAAAGVPLRQRSTPLVVITRRVDPWLGQAARWFAIASGATVLLTALVAVRIARGLTVRLRATEAATRLVAAGDLAARVEVAGRGDEVGDLGTSVNRMAAALERARSAERSFLLAVSHDLRTPLTAIRGWAEALVDGTTREPVRAGRIIEAQARRLERLIDDLLDLARLRAGRFSLDCRPVDLREVAEEAVEAAHPQAAQASVRLAMLPPRTQAVTTAEVDPSRTAQLLADLLDNAVRHARSSVTVDVVAEGSVVQVVVEDDGSGVALEDRQVVFERFWTSGPADGRTSREGLGLAIVAELSRAMGGSVELQDATSGGARFVVNLPRGQAAVPEGPP